MPREKAVNPRTFGLEIEFVNIRKAEVVLPRGYSWSPDEMWILNTDMTPGTPSAKRGGEINTRPLTMCKEDMDELRTFVERCRSDWGGANGWYQSFDTHVWIGDATDVEVLKKFVYACLQLMGCWHKLVKFPDYGYVETWSPIITVEEWKRAQSAKTLEQLRNVFANSSIKGHRRHNLNINPYWKHGTIEFRSFSQTDDWKVLEQQIRFCVELCDYIIASDYPDLDKLASIDFVRSHFKLKHEFSDYSEPLLFAENHRVLTGYKAKAFPVTKRLAFLVNSLLSSAVNLVNPYMYELAVTLSRHRDVTIYSNNEYDHIVHAIATQGLVITYTEHLSVLNEYKDGAASTELSLFFIYSRINKIGIESDHGSREFNAITTMLSQSLIAMSESTEAIVKMMGAVTFIKGTLLDALDTGADTVFLQGHNGKKNSSVTSLKKYSDYEPTYTPVLMDYALVRERTKGNLFIFSQSDYLQYTKIGRDGPTTLYANTKAIGGANLAHKKEEFHEFNLAPDDLVIDDWTMIGISELQAGPFHSLQKTHVKKVAKVKAPRLCYVVTYGDYVIGAFGFDYPKGEGYDLHLLSDFCVNHSIPLVSKLILFLIKTKEARRLIERKISGRVKNAYTKIYTTMPVSMKYRGAFRRSASDPGRELQYDFEFGSGGTIKDAFNEYRKRINAR